MHWGSYNLNRLVKRARREARSLLTSGGRLGDLAEELAARSVDGHNRHYLRYWLRTERQRLERRLALCEQFAAAVEAPESGFWARHQRAVERAARLEAAGGERAVVAGPAPGREVGTGAADTAAGVH
jgi:hypothetical protein